MDSNSLIGRLSGALGDTLPTLVGALLILVVGWFVAVLVRVGMRRGLAALQLNARIRATTEIDMDVERGITVASYYLILVMVLVAFFNALALEQVSGSLQQLVDQILAYGPKVGAAAVLLVVAWVLATLLRTLATRALASTPLDTRLTSEAGLRPMSDSLGNVLYWLVILLFLPGILGALEMKGLLDPVQGMVDQILAILPNLLGAAVIGLVGWFVARILRDLVTNLLAATGADRAGERAGLSGTMSLSRLVGLVVYIFVFVPALIAALNTLAIEAISRPATDMLGAFMAAIPNVFGAALILVIAYVVSTFIANLVTTLLAGVGFDRIPERIGLDRALTRDTVPSTLVGRLVVFFVMLFATVEAAAQLGFAQVSEIVTMLIEFGGQVLLGLVIISVGFWIASLASRGVQRMGGEASTAMSGLVRFAIMGVVIAMGLRAMGLADDIVNLAFGLTLGAVAVAVALSFGLGGRDAAGRQMEHWLGQLRRNAKRAPARRKRAR